MLQTLILSNNTAVSGNITSIKLPPSLKALHLVKTNVSGSFDADWMSRQGTGFDCLLAYNSPFLCGQLNSTLPCSLTQFVQGTGLSELVQPADELHSPVST